MSLFPKFYKNYAKKVNMYVKVEIKLEIKIKMKLNLGVKNQTIYICLTPLDHVLVDKVLLITNRHVILLHL